MQSGRFGATLQRQHLSMGGKGWHESNHCSERPWKSFPAVFLPTMQEVGETYSPLGQVSSFQQVSRDITTAGLTG